MPKADKLIVVTPKIKEMLHNDYRIPESKIVVIENGANTELFKPLNKLNCRATLGLSNADKVICFVGSFHQWHGLEDLIQGMDTVAAKVPDVKLLIIGDDSYPSQKGGIRGKLEKLSRDLNLTEKIIFTGRVPYERVPLYINASDVCLAPFVRERNERCGLSPLKLCEYLACARPVVASRLPGLEFVEEYNAGVLVSPGAPQELAEAIIRLLRDPLLRKQMGENGRKYVVKNHSWKSVARRVAEVCQQVIAEHQKQRKL